MPRGQGEMVGEVKSFHFTLSKCRLKMKCFENHCRKTLLHLAGKPATSMILERSGFKMSLGLSRLMTDVICHDCKLSWMIQMSENAPFVALRFTEVIMLVL